jgi:hypothetical protein
VIQPTGVDVYPGDHPCDWPTYIAAGAPWHFAIFKITQGLDYRYDAWAARQRAPFALSPRIGADLFVGYYHYLTLHQSGMMQADFAVRAVRGIQPDAAPGQLPLMVDVERGGQRIANPSHAQVEDVTRTFAGRYTELTGRTATLYGGELLRSVGVTDRLGCGRSAIALYGSRLPHDVIARTGTNLEHLMLWQYRGTEPQTAGPAGYPLEAPGCGRVDISALVLPGGLEALRELCS